MIQIKILALDQSTKITGYSVWNNRKLVNYGHLESNIRQDNPVERMNIMSGLIRDLIKAENPDYICLEQVQFQNNYRVYSQLSQMQGVIFTILFERD